MNGAKISLSAWLHLQQSTHVVWELWPYTAVREVRRERELVMLHARVCVLAFSVPARVRALRLSFAPKRNLPAEDSTTIRPKSSEPNRIVPEMPHTHITAQRKSVWGCPGQGMGSTVAPCVDIQQCAAKSLTAGTASMAAQQVA